MMNKKKLGSLLLAGAMFFSMGTTVFASSDIPDVNNKGSVSITKKFEMADGLKIPNVTFNFTATSETPDAPNATINPINYNNDDNDEKNLENGKYVISKDTTISFGEFKHAGVYEYIVKETKGGENGIKYDETEYKLRVYVANTPDGSHKIEKITAAVDDDKKEKILFTNTYLKNDANLEILKETEGKYANKKQKFDFKITFEKSPTSDTTTFMGNIGDQQITCEAGTAKDFQLSDGEKLVFENLPVGTTYVVEEIGAEDGYTPKVAVVENGTQTVINKVASNESDGINTLNSEKKNLVGENNNKVTFVNTYKDIAITGVTNNNLPFILLIGVAAVGFGTLAVVKRLRTYER